ncbi:MAG: EamA/RhaT family transporter, partial [Bacteroidetes bacterium]
MIPLVLSILCSSLIFVAFKLFDRFKINTFQAIVFNYFTAFIIGVGLYGNEWDPEALNASAWMYFAVLASMLFISLFILMGLSSQRNGVASTSIAVKMSMAFSMLLMIIGYGENISALKIIGILLAITGVLLVSIEKQSETKSSNSWMLIVLFLGSGGLDFVLNYAQKNILGALTPSLFSAFGLGLAGVFG